MIKRFINLLAAIFLLFMFVGCSVWNCSMISCSCANRCQTGSMISYSRADRYQAGDAILSTPIHDIKIHWISSDVEVLSSTENSVSISETCNESLSDELKVHYWLDGTTLYIEPCASGEVYPSMLEKKLNICLPKDSLQSFQFNSVSGNVALKDIAVKNIVIHTVSGKCSLDGCGSSEQLEVKSTSGELYGSLTGKLENLEFSSVSGSVSLEAAAINHVAIETTSGSALLTLEEAPQTLKHRSVSGGITVTLPESASFVLELKTVSGSFYCDIPHTINGEAYIAGNGDNRYTVHTTSGNVTIYKKID